MFQICGDTGKKAFQAEATVDSRVLKLEQSQSVGGNKRWEWN
jgi:hypothetical protein